GGGRFLEIGGGAGARAAGPPQQVYDLVLHSRRKPLPRLAQEKAPGTNSGGNAAGRRGFAARGGRCTRGGAAPAGGGDRGAARAAARGIESVLRRTAQPSGNPPPQSSQSEGAPGA